MAETSPTLRRRQLAAQLRELRKRAGLSIEEVAQHLLCSTAKISRIETAKRAVSLRDVRDLCKLYGVGDEERIDALMTLAREARLPGLRGEFGYLGEETLQPYIDLEAAASSVLEFQTCFIPGLLQTEDYARTLIRGLLPRIGQDLLDARVRARKKRQERLARAELSRYWAIFDEAALLRVVGTTQVMREQLDHLVEMSELPHVVIQVIPLTVGPYMGLDNSFSLLRMADPSLPYVAYTEGIITAEYWEKKSDIETFQEAFEQIRATALDPQGSINLVKQRRDSI